MLECKYYQGEVVWAKLVQVFGKILQLQKVDIELFARHVLLLIVVRHNLEADFHASIINSFKFLPESFALPDTLLGELERGEDA